MTDLIYNIGDVITVKNSKFLITDRKREIINKKNHTGKIYCYTCLNCGYKGKKVESALKNQVSGCAGCAGNRVVEGYNDIATTNPDKISYFFDESDAKKFTLHSSQKTDFKCCMCGNKIANKTISYMTDKAPICPSCKDNCPMSEKIMWSLLMQLSNDFIYRTQFVWSNDKEYDFYIESLSCIIETHGQQHYTKGFQNVNGRTVEEERENDKCKYEMAVKNGIQNYIVIDCSDTSPILFRKHITESKLAKLYDLDIVDWDKWNKDIMTTFMTSVCELWDSGIRSTEQISKQLKIGLGAVRTYLKRATEVGLCDYDPQIQRNFNKGNKGSPEQVICLNNLFIFNSIKEASSWCGTRKVWNALQGQRQHAGKIPNTNEKCAWMYLKDYYKEHSEIVDKELFEFEHLIKDVVEYKKPKIKVYQYDSNMNLLKIWDCSVRKIEIEMNNCNIHRVVDKEKMSRNYFWRRVIEDTESEIY